MYIFKPFLPQDGDKRSIFQSSRLIVYTSVVDKHLAAAIEGKVGCFWESLVNSFKIDEKHANQISVDQTF